VLPFFILLLLAPLLSWVGVRVRKHVIGCVYLVLWNYVEGVEADVESASSAGLTYEELVGVDCQLVFTVGDPFSHLSSSPSH